MKQFLDGKKIVEVIITKDVEIFQLTDSPDSFEPCKMDDTGNRIIIELEPGDRILYAKYSGTEIKLDGIDYIVLNEKDILAKLIV